MSTPVRSHGGGVETRVAELERKLKDVYTKAESSALIATGSVVGSALAAYTANASLTAVIPQDDTIPQNTEGTQILSISITPSSASNTIRLRFQGYGSTAAGPATIFAAAFRGAVANAVGMTFVTVPTANYALPFLLELNDAPATTSAVTYTIRVGPGAAGTVRLNGHTIQRFGGGVSACTLVVEEIKA